MQLCGRRRGGVSGSCDEKDEGCDEMSTLIIASTIYPRSASSAGTPAAAYQVPHGTVFLQGVAFFDFM